MHNVILRNCHKFKDYFEHVCDCSQVRQSSASLLGYLRGVSKSASSLEPFTENLLAVFRTFHKDDRVVLPLMKTLDLLLSNGAFDVFIQDETSVD